MLKDVIQKIPLYTLSESGAVAVSIDLHLIADSLGMNLDAGNSVLYMGDNPENGFEFYYNGTNTLYIYLYCQGVRKSGSGDIISAPVNSNNAYLYYIKGKSGTVAFGISSDGSVKLQFICGKAINIVDALEKYGYLLCVYGSYANSGTYVMSDGYYKSNWFDSGGLQEVSDYFAQFHPMCSHQGDLFENVYVATIFKQTTDYQLFTMNDKNYAALNMGKNNGIRYITEF